MVVESSGWKSLRVAETQSRRKKKVRGHGLEGSTTAWQQQAIVGAGGFFSALVFPLKPPTEVNAIFKGLDFEEPFRLIGGNGKASYTLKVSRT